MLASALKKGLLNEEAMKPAIEEAAMLNAAAAEAMSAVGVHACTDISGFGLLGHLSEMLDAGGVAALVFRSEVPLHDQVLDFISQEVYAGGLRVNRDYVLPRVSGVGVAAAAAGEADPLLLALFDPQTSGGCSLRWSPGGTRSWWSA